MSVRSKNAPKLHQCVTRGRVSLERICRIVFFQPGFQDAAVVFVAVHETHMAGAFHQFPAAAGNSLVHGAGDSRCAQVLCAAEEQTGAMNLAQTVDVFKISEAAGGHIFVRPPAVKIRFMAETLGAGQAFGAIFVRAGAVQGHEPVIRAEVGGILKIARLLGVADGLLVLFRHQADHPVLFAGPEAGGGVAAGNDGRADAVGFLLDEVGDDEHAAPGLPQDVEPVEMQVLPQGDEFVHPRILCPQFRMPVQEGIAASDLVVGDHLAPRFLRHAVEYFKIIVGAAGPAVQKQQRHLVLGSRSYNPVVRLVAQKGHVSLFDFHISCL